MYVTCIANSGHQLPDSSIDDRIGHSRDTEFPLTIGREYAVYAVTSWGGEYYYYVFDDNDQEYPVWNLARLFEVSDGSIPASWVFSYLKAADPSEDYFVMSFPAWATDRYFYERLVDGEPEAKAAFAQHRPEAERRGPTA